MSLPLANSRLVEPIVFTKEFACIGKLVVTIVPFSFIELFPIELVPKLLGILFVVNVPDILVPNPSTKALVLG